MTDMFGQYKSQKTRALESIQSSKYPDTNKDLEANLRRLNVFVDYLAQYVGAMQKGVDQANQDVIGRTRDILGNMVVLLGGGTIADVDFGDLQYFLPAIGALLGFDETTPFPINLFNAAEHFFLGYVVPLDSFAIAIEDQVDAVLTALGIDQAFIDAFNELMNALSDLGMSTTDFFHILEQLVTDIFGITDTNALGPFADLWHSLTQLLSGLNLKTLGTLVDPVFEALAPWIHDIALAVEYLDQIIKSFSAGVTDLTGVLNFAGIFTAVIPDFSIPSIGDNPLGAWAEIFAGALQPLQFFGDLGAIFGDFLGGGDITQSVDALVNHIISLPDVLTNLLNSLIDQLLILPDVLTDLLTQVINFIIGAPELLLSLLTGLVNLLVETPDVLLNLLTALIDLLINVPEILINLLGALINLLLNSPTILTDLVNGIIDLLVTLPDTLVTLVTSLINALLDLPDLLTTLIDGIVNQLVTLPDSLTTLATGLIDQILLLPDQLTNLAVGLVDQILALPDTLLQLATGMIDTGNLMGPDSPLNALNLFNLIPGASIPALDASKVQFGQMDQARVSGLASALAAMLTPSSPINAQNLFNQIPSSLLGLIPVSQIGNANPNLLANPGFDTAASLVGNPGWVWDGADGHTALGCASTTADGTAHAIISNSIQVAQGQTLTVGAWYKTLGITSLPGLDAIRVNVLSFLGTTQVGTTVIGSVVGPTGNTVNAGHNNFIQISGNYPVPAGVDNIVVQLLVTANAQSGTVKFDDAQGTKGGLMPQNLITNLPNDLAAGIAFTQATIDQGWQAIFGGSATGKTPTDFKNALKNVPGTNIATPILASLIPQLDASKVQFGVLDLARIPTPLLGLTTINDVQDMANKIAGAFNPGAERPDPITGLIPVNTVPTMRKALDTLFANVQALNSKVNLSDAVVGGAANSGMAKVFDFSTYADNPNLPTSGPEDFDILYSGPGVGSTIGTKSGSTHWYLGGDGARIATCHVKVPTKTTYQRITSTVSGPPDSGGPGYIIGRTSANNLDFCFVEVICTGFLAYSMILGYYLNGNRNVWAGPKAIPAAYDAVFLLGTGKGERNYQVLVGGQLIFDYTESGTLSKSDINHLYWGIRGETDGKAAPPDITDLAVADNMPPNVIGSYFRQYRTDATVVGCNSGFTVLNPSFFNQRDSMTSDFLYNQTTNGLTISTEGTYYANLRYAINNLPGNGKFDPVLFRDNGSGPQVIRRGNGAFADSAFGANSPSGIGTGFVVYCKPGDILFPGTWCAGNYGSLLTGDASGATTYFEVGLLNRSLA